MLSVEAQAFFAAHGGAVIEHMDMLQNAPRPSSALLPKASVSPVSSGAIGGGARSDSTPVARLAQIQTAAEIHRFSLSELQGLVLHLRLMPMEQVGSASTDVLVGALAGYLEQQKNLERQRLAEVKETFQGAPYIALSVRVKAVGELRPLNGKADYFIRIDVAASPSAQIGPFKLSDLQDLPSIALVPTTGADVTLTLVGGGNMQVFSDVCLAVPLLDLVRTGSVIRKVVGDKLKEDFLEETRKAEWTLMLLRDFVPAQPNMALAMLQAPVKVVIELLNFPAMGARELILARRKLSAVERDVPVRKRLVASHGDVVYVAEEEQRGCKGTTVHMLNVTNYATLCFGRPDELVYIYVCNNKNLVAQAQIFAGQLVSSKSLQFPVQSDVLLKKKITNAAIAIQAPSQPLFFS